MHRVRTANDNDLTALVSSALGTLHVLQLNKTAFLQPRIACTRLNSKHIKQ